MRSWQQISPRLGSAVLQMRRAQLLCGCWKADPHAAVEEHGPLVICNFGVHHSAVPVALNVAWQALKLAPRHLRNLVALQTPCSEALKGVEEAVSFRCGYKVDEGISDQSITTEIEGRVEKIIATFEALGVNEVQEFIATVVVRQIPPHDCCLAACSLTIIFVMGRDCSNWNEVDKALLW